MVTKKSLKGADPALQQQAEFQTVRTMKLRFGNTMTFDPCEFCGHWSVTSLGYGKLHPTCYADPERQKAAARVAKKAAKAPDKDQGLLL